MTVFLLIRHAQTPDTGARLSGRLPDVGLSDLGSRQAERLGDRLVQCRPAALCSSPAQRARATATLLAAPLMLTPRPMDAFDEIDFGDWQGMGFDELDADPLWQRFNRRRVSTRPPRGELAGETLARFLAGLVRLRREFADGSVAVVSHGDPIRYALTALLGLPLSTFPRLRIDPASVSTVRWDGERPRLLCLNSTETIAHE